jgi:hypothetical protein
LFDEKKPKVENLVTLSLQRMIGSLTQYAQQGKDDVWVSLINASLKGKKKH